LSTRVHGRYLHHNPDRRVVRDIVGGRGHGGLERDLDDRSRRVMAAARTLVRVRTGTLLTSIRREEGVGPLGRYIDIVAGIPGLTTYLGYEHDGTQPHVIRPRRRKALRFIAGGQVVFATRVNHPGTRGSHFLSRALAAAR
jgi:hypothetical protein